MNVEVASRELLNDTGGLLRRVEEGETIVITRRGKPVADLVPHRRVVSRWFTPDEVVEISSYLDPEEYVRAARESGADAIHPGYGFLSESSEFAETVVEAGLTWIGPSPKALLLGGDKLRASAPEASFFEWIQSHGDPD